MNLDDWAKLALALGVGGIAGAMASMVRAVSRVESDLARFSDLLRSAGSSPEIDPIKVAFEALRSDIREALSAWQRLRAVLKWR